jgi:tetratricopeptide (TPR) repeat protein
VKQLLARVIVGAGVLLGLCASAQAAEDWKVATDAGFAAFREGRLADAEKNFKLGLSLAEKEGAKAGITNNLGNLGVVYRQQGKQPQAREQFARMLQIFETGLGKDHPEVGNALTLVGETYLAEGKLEEAQPRLERAVAVLSKADANYQRNLALALNNLGTLRAHQNRFPEAAEAYRRALDINMKVAPQDPAVSQGLNNLATVEARAGRFADAERDFKKALEMQERGAGPNHPSVGNTLYSLGGVYSSLGRNAEAAEAFKRSLAIMEKAVGPDHPVIASILEGYASVLDALKKKPEADAMRKRAKAIQDKRR